MIPSSKRLAALVVVASAGAHLAGVGVVMRESAVQMAGGAEVAVASLGSSFADLSAGVVQPEVVTPVETETPEPPVQTAMAVTDAVMAVEPPATLAPVTPKVAVTTPVMQTARTLPPVVPIAPPVAQAPAPPVEVQAALTPEVAPTPPVERTEAEPEPDTPATSPRPPKRPEAVAQEPPARPAPTGNADRNARTGTDMGRAEAMKSAAQSTQAAHSQQAGNAAVDNYPGQVMRRISRVPRPRVSVRAAATVSFSIAANGALASVSIARTSGSAELDAAALAVLRKAAPFPAPPSGARRRFTIRIEGR